VRAPIRHGLVRRPVACRGNDRRRYRARHDAATAGHEEGTLIRHATLGAAQAPAAHAIPVVQFSFGALLVTAIGRPMLLAAPEQPARLGAVALPAIARATNGKGGAAIGTAANSNSENDLRARPHGRREAALDKGDGS